MASPVAFDNVDMSKYLNEISSLKSEIMFVTKMLENSERKVLKLSDALSKLHSDDVASTKPAQRKQEKRQVKFELFIKKEPTKAPVQDNSRDVQASLKDCIRTSPEKQAQESDKFLIYQPIPRPLTTSFATIQERNSSNPFKKGEDDSISLEKQLKSQQSNKHCSRLFKKNIQANASNTFLPRLDHYSLRPLEYHQIIKRCQSEIDADGRAIVKLQHLESRIDNFKGYMMPVATMNKHVFFSPDFSSTGAAYSKYWET